MAAAYERARCQLIRELVVLLQVGFWVVLTRQIRTRRIDIVHRRHHIGHTATAVQVIDNERGRLGNLQEKPLGSRHLTLVTTAVQVTDLTRQQVPGRTDVHLGQVVTAEEATHLVGAAAGLRERRVDAHLLETGLAQQVLNGFSLCRGRCVLHPRVLIDKDMVGYSAGVIHMDDRLLVDGSVVTTTVGIYDGTAVDFQVGLVQDGLMEADLAVVGDYLSQRRLVFSVASVVDVVRGFTLDRTILHMRVVEITVTTAEELTDIHLLGICRRLDIAGLLAVSCGLGILCGIGNFFFCIMLRNASCLAIGRISFARCSYLSCGV